MVGAEGVRARLTEYLLLSTLSLSGIDALGQESKLTVPGGTAPSDEPTLPMAKNQDLEFVRRRGVELYEHHRAALVALEAGREVGLSDTAPEGWIVLREANTLRVRFVAPCPEGPCSVLDVEIDDEQLAAHALYPPEPLDSRGIASWRARNLVLTSQTATCAVPYNIVTFPPDDSQPEWTAYLIAQPEDENVIAIGGHMRVFLDAEARTVRVAEDFSSACLLGRRDSSRGVLGISYAQGSMPTEVHVLQSLLHQVVLHVGTHSGVFTVDGDEIHMLAEQDGYGVP